MCNALTSTIYFGFFQEKDNLHDLFKHTRSTELKASKQPPCTAGRSCGDLEKIALGGRGHLPARIPTRNPTKNPTKNPRMFEAGLGLEMYEASFRSSDSTLGQ